MKKKFCLALCLFLLAAPLCAAAYFAFSGPAVVLHAPYTGPNREAYKPYPAPRGAVPMSRYRSESARQFLAVEQSFADIDAQIERAVEAAAIAAREFDELVVPGRKARNVARSNRER